MHYAGLLRVVRRDAGIRIYAARAPSLPPATSAEREERLDALVDVAIQAYAPLPAVTLSHLVGRLRYAAPQWTDQRKGALRRARARLAHARVEEVDWFWPADERVQAASQPPDVARLLSPFDPLVWDRPRFERLWGWPYRFEAYTPAAKRRLGYYALPLLWKDRVMGWGTVTIRNGAVQCTIGYTASHPPRDRAFKRELEAEIDRMRVFLGL